MRLPKVIILSTALSFTGCATVLVSPLQTVTVYSNPQDADVYVSPGQRPDVYAKRWKSQSKATNPDTANLAPEIHVAITPGFFQVPRGKRIIIRVSKEGYESIIFSPKKKMTGLFWVNLLFGGLPGMIVDMVTGAAYEYQPMIFVNLPEKQ